jgi:predicted deacetylase
MSEPIVIQEISPENQPQELEAIEAPMASLIQEIKQTPPEYWPNLLEMIRLFRKSVTKAQRSSQLVAVTNLPKISQEEQIKRNQAAIELLRQWREEGDEQEQTETAEYLRQVLDEDRLSNRPLFL